VRWIACWPRDIRSPGDWTWRPPPQRSGRDLEAATDIHALLARLLNLGSPLYHHHALLTDEHGLKLAKSRFSHSLADMRDAGETPEAVRARLGFA
jgi:glutamyl-Q tRNA(Asp) synthetase